MPVGQGDTLHRDRVQRQIMQHAVRYETEQVAVPAHAENRFDQRPQYVLPLRKVDVEQTRRPVPGPERVCDYVPDLLPPQLHGEHLRLRVGRGGNKDIGLVLADVVLDQRGRGVSPEQLLDLRVRDRVTAAQRRVLGAGVGGREVDPRLLQRVAGLPHPVRRRVPVRVVRRSLGREELFIRGLGGLRQRLAEQLEEHPGPGSLHQHQRLGVRLLRPALPGSPYPAEITSSCTPARCTDRRTAGHVDPVVGVEHPLVDLLSGRQRKPHMPVRRDRVGLLHIGVGQPGVRPGPPS